MYETTVGIVNVQGDRVLGVFTCVVALAALFLFSRAPVNFLDSLTKPVFAIAGQVLESIGSVFSFSVLRWLYSDA